LIRFNEQTVIQKKGTPGKNIDMPLTNIADESTRGNTNAKAITLTA